MTFGWTTSLFQFILGTLTLWVCSYTVDTPTPDLKSAAIYNAILQVLCLIFAGIIFILKPGTFGSIILVFSIVYFISFFLLKKMYGTSILNTTWLVIACWAVKAGAEKFITAVL